MPETVWRQKTFALPASARGAHLVTAAVKRELLAELAAVRVGLLHLFAQHKAAALSLKRELGRRRAR